MIDSHCHLHFDNFDGFRNKVIEDIEQRMDFAVLAGCGPEDNLKALEIAETSEKLGYCMGVHPCSIEKFSEIERIKNQIRRKDVLAVGEIGLDHYHVKDRAIRENQKKVFREMLSLAEDMSLPVVVHSREAERKSFEIVSEYDVHAFFHCFNGSTNLAKEIVNSNHFIGVTGQLINSKDVQNILDIVSLDNLLLETDSPYLGEQMPNTPLYTFKIAEKASQLLNVPLKELSNKCTDNASKFYTI